MSLKNAFQQNILEINGKVSFYRFFEKKVEKLKNA